MGLKQRCANVLLPEFIIGSSGMDRVRNSGYKGNDFGNDRHRNARVLSLVISKMYTYVLYNDPHPLVSRESQGSVGPCKILGPLEAAKGISRRTRVYFLHAYSSGRRKCYFEGEYVHL